MTVIDCHGEGFVLVRIRRPPNAEAACRAASVGVKTNRPPLASIVTSPLAGSDAV